MVACAYAAQFPLSIATGGSPAGEKAREQQAPFNSDPTDHGVHTYPTTKSATGATAPMRCGIRR